MLLALTYVILLHLRPLEMKGVGREDMNNQQCHAGIIAVARDTCAPTQQKPLLLFGFPDGSMQSTCR